MENHRIKCDIKNKKVTLSFERKTPKGCPKCYARVTKFDCSEESNCEYYKNHNCKYAKK